MRCNFIRFLALLLVTLAVPSCWSSDEKPAPPALSVSPDHVDFGQAGVGETVHRTVAVTNLGGAPLSVDRIRVTAPFAVLETSLTLAPGESRSLGLKFSPAESGLAEAVLGIGSARGVVRVSLRGAAHGVPALHVDRQRVEFGEVAIGELSTALLTIENRGLGALRVSKLVVAAPFEASADVSEVAPGGRARVEIRFAPQSPRDSDAVLRIESNDPRAERARIALAGTGVEEPPAPAVQVSPMALDFGVVPVGSTQESRIEIRNAGRDPLTLSSVTLEPPFHASTGSRRIAPGSSVLIGVSFSPSEQGPRMESMQLHSNDPRHGVLVVVLLGDAADRVGASEADREMRPDGEEETESSVDADSLAEVGDAAEVGSGGTRSLVDVEGETTESVDSELAEEGFDIGSGPGFAEGSQALMGSYGMRSGDVYVDSFAIDAESGTVSLSGVELPTVYTEGNQTFSFSAASGAGSIDSRGGIHVELPVQVEGVGGESDTLIVALTTGTASTYVGGQPISIQGIPMGPDNIATLVGLVNIETGPLKSDTLRIVLQVQIEN